MEYTIPSVVPAESIRSVVDAMKFLPEPGVERNRVKITVPLAYLPRGVLLAVAKSLESAPAHVEFIGGSGQPLTFAGLCDYLGNP